MHIRKKLPGIDIAKDTIRVICNQTEEYGKELDITGKFYNDKNVLNWIRAITPKVVRSLQVGQVLDIYEAYWTHIEKHEGKNLISKVNSWLIEQAELESAKRYA